MCAAAPRSSMRASKASVLPPLPQSTINKLLVKHALQRKLVVRLKGGDVSVFSNVLDELQTLIEHNIPYEIVPGITAAAGAAAYAGIPLTARGYHYSGEIPDIL